MSCSTWPRRAGSRDPKVLETQVRRLLADPRSKSLVTNFAFQWLKVRGIDNIDPDAVVFPNFDDGLRDAFRSEMELFVDSILREDRSVLDLLTADHTFVNERLALHYGIPNVRGEQFRRVTLTDPNRWGLLGKGSVLMTTSYANRTAPGAARRLDSGEHHSARRRRRRRPTSRDSRRTRKARRRRSVREIMEQHRSKPSCNACHGVMDPLGFALENFDAIGEWRSKDRYAGTAIDASGKLVDGTPVNSPADLRKALMKRPEQFVQTMTEKLMTYALGRSVEYYDMPAVRAIVRDAARDNYRFSSIVMGIVRSAPFQMRKAPSRSRRSTRRSRETRQALRLSDLRVHRRRVQFEQEPVMFITKKHLSRRTFLRGAGVTVGLPLLDAMIPAWTALAQTAASPKPRMGFMYLPHGAIMDQWTPAAEGHELRADADSQAVRAVPEAVDDRQRTGEQAGDRAARARAQPGNLAELRDAARGPGTARRRDRRSDRRRAPRPGHAAAVARSGDRGTRRQGGACDRNYGCSYGGTISFRTPTTPLPDGSRSAQAVRAALRSGRHAAGAEGDREAVLEHSRPGHRRGRRSPQQSRRRRIARGSATTWKAFARSSGVSRRWKSGI